MRATDVIMPRLGVNDDNITLVSWLVKNGETVAQGQKIAEIETSKETSELKATVSGRIEILGAEGTEVAVGSVVARIVELSDLKLQEGGIGNENAVAVRESSENIIQITNKARKLVEENHIDMNLLPKNGLIREKDVLALMSAENHQVEIRYNKVLIYGGGGFGQVASEILRNQHIFELYGFVDCNYPDKREAFGVPIVGNDDDLERLYQDGYTKIINAVEFLNKAHHRKVPYDMLSGYGFEFINVIHPSAQIEPSARIGVGNLVCAGAIIGGEVNIGNNCIVNCGAIVSHFTKIRNHCHIASGAVLAASVTVGENTLVGQNCTVYSDVIIGRNVTVLNGCNVFKSVPDNMVVKEDYR